MSDDRITDSPTPPRCPICATGFTFTPGAKCPACGRTFSHHNPRPADVRRPLAWTLPALLGWMACILVGISLLIAIYGVTVGFHVNVAKWVPLPGLILLAALFLVPVFIRTLRLTSQGGIAGRDYFFGALISSLGVATLAGVASVITFGIVCFAVSTDNDGVNFQKTVLGVLIGAAAGFVVFLLLFLRLWPRRRPGQSSPPDPEN